MKSGNLSWIKHQLSLLSCKLSYSSQVIFLFLAYLCLTSNKHTKLRISLFKFFLGFSWWASAAFNFAIDSVTPRLLMMSPMSFQVKLGSQVLKRLKSPYVYLRIVWTIRSFFPVFVTQVFCLSSLPICTHLGKAILILDGQDSGEALTLVRCW